MLLVLLTIIGGFAGYILYSNNSAKKDIEDLNRQYYSDTVTDKKKNINWNSLLSRNSDTVAWLKIQGVISTPVVRGADNDYYLRRSFDKERTYSGTCFMDFRNVYFYNDNNIILYGHNLLDGNGFQKVLNTYKESGGAEEHPIIELLTPEKDYKYLVIGSFYTNSYKSDDNGYVFPYNMTRLNSGDYSDFQKQIDLRLMYKHRYTELETNDQLLMLSTCAYQFSGERFVVVARRIKDSENVNEFKFDYVYNADARYPQRYYNKKGKTNPYKNTKNWYPTL